MAAEDDYKRFSEIAQELGLEDKDHDNFINSAMKRKGYKPVMSWTDPEPEDGGGGGDFFSGGGSREKRDVGGGGKRSGGSGWQYDN